MGRCDANKLYDANGDEIPTDLCYCGRPKLARSEYCCSGCLSDAMGERQGSRHLSGCNVRCATMGVPGFGVRASERRAGSDRVIPINQERLRFEASLERAGADARHSGELKSDNPYGPDGSRKAWHNAWRRGWERGWTTTRRERWAAGAPPIASSTDACTSPNGAAVTGCPDCVTAPEFVAAIDALVAAAASHRFKRKVNEP